MENLQTDFNMKKISALIIITLVFCVAASAQTVFISTGFIEYERRMNQFSFYDKEDEESVWIQEMKKTFPKMVNDVYHLYFNNQKTVYKLGVENTNIQYVWGRKPGENDVTVRDLVNNTISVQRDVFEQTYLIKDSIRQNKWRITNETRTIAGFECRKAVTIICDSVYVVAFYTDEIAVSGGPENFGGLPGMILGLAVPRLQMTWFATKVVVQQPTEAVLNPRQKGKTVTWLNYEKDLNKAVGDWGKYGAKVIWNLML
jgi:GLPGLI family protein